MSLAVLLPPTWVEYLRQFVPEEEYEVACSWRDLDSLVSCSRVKAVVLDPSIGGGLRIERAVTLLRTYPLMPVFAYVSLTPTNLRAVLRLSNCGLERAFLHPLPKNDQSFRKAIEAAAHSRNAYAVLGLIEPALGKLAPPLARALWDLFERPHRYATASDIALEAGNATRDLYRAFLRAGLGTPKKLVTVAKVVRGYSYLRFSKVRVGCVSRKLGYTHARAFAEQTVTVLGCPPSKLRTQINPEEASLRIVEWLFKPCNLKCTIS